jgi:hypothetical protein
MHQEVQKRIKTKSTSNLTIFTVNYCSGQQEDEVDEEELPHVCRRKRSPAPPENLQPPICCSSPRPVPLATNGEEEKHLPPLLQPPICLIQHSSIEQDAETKRGSAKKWKGEEETRREGRGVEADRGVEATWGYKYENTEKEGVLYKSNAGRRRWRTGRVTSVLRPHTRHWQVGPIFYFPHMSVKGSLFGSTALSRWQAARITLRISGIQRLKHDLGPA